MKKYKENILALSSLLEASRNPLTAFGLLFAAPQRRVDDLQRGGKHPQILDREVLPGLDKPSPD